jgi:predicted GNAT superfamily acetyltransferase
MAEPDNNIRIKECDSLSDLADCVELQREVFALPELEISPVRHFIVTKNAGGFTLGAFDGQELIGFVLSVPAYLRGQRAFYSHMTAVRSRYQSYGIGAQLKWAQRERSLLEGVKLIKWTFEPTKARNAYFNLQKLGAVVREYKENFYGTDYSTAPQENSVGLASDRLFAEWELESEKVKTLAAGQHYCETEIPVASISIPADWYGLVKWNSLKAFEEQLRIRREFETAFADRLICRGFERSDTEPKFMLFEDK